MSNEQQAPKKESGVLKFTLFGIDVRVEPWFWFIALMLGYRQSDPAYVTLIWVIAVFVSVLIHEFGHALTAKFYGSPSRIVLYSMGGLAYHNPLKRFQSIAVSFAGPAAGFSFMFVLIAMSLSLGGQLYFTTSIPWLYVETGWENEWVNIAFRNLMFINIAWGLINLAPILPLDGGHITANLFGGSDEQKGYKIAIMFSILFSVVVAAWGYFELGSVYMLILFGYFGFTNAMSLRSLSSSDDRPDSGRP